MNIASDFGTAAGAVTEISSVSVNKGQQVSLDKSTINSITTGVEVNNQLLSDLGTLIACVKE